MELNIKNVEESKIKKVHKSGSIFGVKKWAGRTVMVLLLKEKKYTQGGHLVEEVEVE